MTHEEIIALVQAHKRGKDIQIKVDGIWLDKGAEFFTKKSAKHFLHELFHLENEVRVKPENERYAMRAWREDEVPEIAVYAEQKYGIMYVRTSAELLEMGSGNLEFILKNLRVSYDSGRTWHPCGVEVEDE